MGAISSIYTSNYINIPEIGEISAGKPIEALPIIGWHKTRAPKDYRASSERLFALRIVGDSLINSGIHNGDYVICRLIHECSNGKLAAVLTPEGVTLKYFYCSQDGRVRLESDNPDYPDRYFEPGEVRVQGVAVRIERDL
jgi:repressor LexA